MSKSTSSPSSSSTTLATPFNIQLSHPRFLIEKEIAAVNSRLLYISEGVKHFETTKASFMEKAVRRNIIDLRKRLCLPMIPQSCEFDSLVKVNSETTMDFLIRSTFFVSKETAGFDFVPKDHPYRIPTPEQLAPSAPNLPPPPVSTRGPSPERATPLPAPTPIRPIRPIALRPITPPHITPTPRSPPPKAKSPSLPLSPSIPSSSSPSPSPSPLPPSPTPSTGSSMSIASTIIIDGSMPYSAPAPNPIPTASSPTYAQIASKPSRPLRITQRRLKESSEMETIRASFNNHPLARRPLPHAPPPTPTSESVRKEAFKNHNKSVNKSLAQIKEAIRSNRAAAEKHKSAPVVADPSPPIATPPPQIPNPSNIQGFFSPPTGTKGYAPLLIPFSTLALLFASLDKEA
ncbi:hypothetical protein BOTBODRAFT_191358 [Botryobasidium botryosum FD-172 SS1]|uniref:Uncharacterized protein n=1 Tax=Botryobasidium botryosum (strain FD-172 SS1) TaxID=930990 RepID=A0A067M0F7_BOTB1|nr:hypothetical protein BOTBODRAFT_191358 [Botryobasidium botryosum FD-172 SS1]